MPFGLLDKFLQHFKQVTRARFQKFEFKPNWAGGNSNGPAHTASTRRETRGIQIPGWAPLVSGSSTTKRYGAMWCVGLEVNPTAVSRLLHRDERGEAEP